MIMKAMRYCLLRLPKLFARISSALDGSFSCDCQQLSVPSSLKTLVSMLANLKDQDVTDSQVNLTIAQLILFYKIPEELMLYGIHNYISSSIKESAREKRGKGIRRKVVGKNKIPQKWADFLCDPANKQELFPFLSNKLANVNYPQGKEIVITSDVSCIVRGADR